MRWTFGTVLTRLLWGGTTLRLAERKLLDIAVAELPPAIRTTVETQLAAYNLAQREVGGRTINFYRKAMSNKRRTTSMPQLKTRQAQAPLVRIKVCFDKASEPVHAVLTAVHGRVFCLTLSRAITPNDDASRASMLDSVASWRSTVVTDATG
jgi:hypothetical protein